MEQSVTTKDEVLSTLRAHKTALRALGVDRLGLFGSFRHGTAGPHSDVDLLIEFSTGRKSLVNYLDAYDLVEEILGRKVDLVTPKSLSKYCAPRILAEAEYFNVNN